MNFKKVKKWFRKNITFDRIIAVIGLIISALSLFLGS
jgi:hypothetical protein